MDARRTEGYTIGRPNGYTKDVEGYFYFQNIDFGRLSIYNKKSMKKVIGIIFVTVLMGPLTLGGFAEDYVMGFNGTIVNSDTDFNTYDVIFLEKIDVKDINLPGSALFYDYDDESGGMLEEDAEKEDIEYRYRQIFGKALSTVLPVTYGKMDKKDQREMILVLKIEGDLKETRFLENLIPDEKKEK